MRFWGVIFAVLLSLPFHLYGSTKRDTIYTTDGDRIILTYEITNSANQTVIRFTGQQKRLGKINAKYKDLSKVAVLFFDRTGDYGDGVSIVNMVPEAFMVPLDVQFQESRDGFYLVQAEPQLTFTVKKNTEINIPIYLAYKPKKGKYILFSKSAGLKVPLWPKSESVLFGATDQTVQQIITSTSEIEPDNTVTIKVLESINLAKDLISETTELPFSDNVLDEINYLRQKRRELTDDALVSQITDLMNQYDSKRKMLEEKSAAEQQAHLQQEEQRMREEAQTVKAQNDSIATAQKEATEKEKKRNFWMIVGGIILVILAFIGNQIFQSIRNKRNQLRMMDMQQNIAKQAEKSAKRRARNAIRSQRNRVVNDVKQEATNTIRKKVTINIKGKSKKASI